MATVDSATVTISLREKILRGPSDLRRGQRSPQATERVTGAAFLGIT